VPTTSGRAWNPERTGVRVAGKSRSNKYSLTDSHKKPAPRMRVMRWVGGYTRSDGVHVKGHYRKIS
jgi:hypothetical protein